MGTTIIYEKEEIVLNFEKFTLVKVETDKGIFQSSLRGHDHHHDKLKRPLNKGVDCLWWR